jgi:putative tryptophan/tyrosine transport system substrate-binding protein
MRRREFLGLILGPAAAWPLPAFAQSQQAPVIGFLNGSSPDGYAPMVNAFRMGLREAGYVEGQTVQIEFRWANGDYDKLPQLAAELLDRHVSVIVANTPANLVAKKSTVTVPIVFTTGSDPVAVGLVPNLNHPGGNVTGVSQLNVEVGPKLVELAHELLPDAKVGLLVNPSNVESQEIVRNTQDAARSLKVFVEVLHADTDRELESVFAEFSKANGGVLTVASDAFFFGRTQQLAQLARRYAIPTIDQIAAFTAAGGLMSYGGDVNESYHLAGGYVGRILRGEKPADLPVQQSTKVELTINLKAAKSLGIHVPPSLLARADEIIE